MADVRHLRKQNEQRVVSAMLRLGKTTRSDLSKETRMSQPTIGRIVDGLLKTDTLTELDDPRGSADSIVLGRPSKSLVLNSSIPRFLGLQLGVRNTRLASLAVAPTPSDVWTAEFATPTSSKKWKEKLAAVVSKLPLKNLAGVVFSLPGVVDEHAGRVLFSPNLRWIEEIDFASLGPTFQDLPITVSQEIRILALGQFVIHPQVKNFLLVDIGSGVGAAVLRDGAVMSSALPLSGELGHSPVIGNTRPCSCGSVGCVETLVSRTGLLASARENRWPATWPEFIQKMHTQRLPDWLAKSFDALATTISAAMNIIGLDHVVITGALQEIPAHAVQYLHDRITEGTLWRRFGAVSSRIEERHRLAGMTAFAIDRLLLAESA